MADLSNRTLAVFLITSIVVSVGGFFILLGEGNGLTGRAVTDLGDANFSINASINVAFISNMAEFGVGTVNGSGSHNCTLNTSVASFVALDCLGFNAPPIQPLRIQNQGTQNVTLNISFNATGSEFIGGTAPEISFKWSANESTFADTCSTGWTAVTPMTVKNQNYSLCNSTRFNWVTGKRTVNLDIGLRIPQDAPTGSRKLRITAYASSP